MKQLWRDLRAVVREAAHSALAKLVVGLLAALGGASLVAPAETAHVVGEATGRVAVDEVKP